MVKLTAVCIALFSCLAFAPESASPAPASPAPSQPPSVTVRLLSANGSGCPSGSAAVSQPSSTEFRITYSQYIATAGGGAPPVDFRKNCQLNVDVAVPSGWTYGMLPLDYRGYVHLDRGAYAVVSTSYYYAGLPQTYQQRHSLYGPQDSDYEYSAPAGTAWAPCQFNTTLNIDTAVRVFAGRDQSFIDMVTMSYTDAGSNTSYHLALRRC